MNLENFVISVERDYPNGRFIHDIREKGCMFKFYVKSYLEKNKNSDLFVANEYLRSLNKILNSHYNLSDISELENCELITKINKYNI